PGRNARALAAQRRPDSFSSQSTAAEPSASGSDDAARPEDPPDEPTEADSVVGAMVAALDGAGAGSVTRAAAGTRGAGGVGTVAGGVGLDATGAAAAGRGALAVAADVVAAGLVDAGAVAEGAVDVAAVEAGTVAERLGAGVAGGVLDATGAG